MNDSLPIVESTPRVFVSYAHKGEGARVVDRLRKLLNTLGLPCIIWSDHDIGAGDEWKRKIQDALRDAAVAVLLIDEDFLDSSFIRTHELPSLLTRRSGKAQPVGAPAPPCRVVPVLVQDCLYAERLPMLSARQFEPENTLRRRIDKDRKAFPDLLTLEDIAGEQFKAETTRFYKQLVRSLNESVQEAHAWARRMALEKQDAQEGGESAGNDDLETDAGPRAEPGPAVGSVSDPAAGEPAAHAGLVRYLRRGDDITRDSVDVQVSLLPLEWTTYRVILRYSFSGVALSDGSEEGEDDGSGDEVEDRTEFWSGLVSLDPRAGIAGHGAQPLLDVSLHGPDANGEPVRMQDKLNEARSKAESLGVPLQLRIAISAGAGELQEIPFESLPLEDGVSVCEQSGIMFSRAVLSTGDDPVEFQPRAHGGFRLLAAVSTRGAGSAAAATGNPQPHLDAMRDSLRGLLSESDGGEDLNDPDLGTFEATVREDASCDVLYIACEGGREGQEYFLHFPDGELSRTRIAQLFRRTPVPRMVILVPLHVLTGGDAPAGSREAILHVAAQFSRLGVATVLSVNAPMPAPSWHAFVKRFSQALSLHGHVSGAVVEAREALSGSPHGSAPVLVARLKATRLWFSPGFIAEDRRPTTRWRQLVDSLDKHRLCPVIGPRIHYRLQQQRVVLAREMADKHGFPLGFSHRLDLPSVTQYVRTLYPSNSLFIEEFANAMRARLRAASQGKVSCDSPSLKHDAYRVAHMLLSQEPDNPYNGLARLPIELYLTTALGPYLEAALDLVKDHGQGNGARALEDFSVLDFAKVDVGRVNANPDQILPANAFTPTSPLVVHFYGSYEDLSRAVITEDDYYEMLASFNERMGDVRSALCGKLSEVDLVFLGFKWNSLDFRVIFRALQRYADKFSEDAFHLAVQIDPDDDDTLHPEKVREYLRRHLSGASRLPQARLSLFLGSPEDFVSELERRWREAKAG